MHFLVLATSLSLAAAQTVTSALYKSSATSSSAVVTHTVNVAKANHAFDPDVVLANPGDVIEYQFYPTNHSVIRAAYGYPCVPYELVEGADHFGFFSGFKPVDAVLANPPIWRLTVNDTEPVFYYCGAPGSCNGWAMVGVINPSANTSLQNQKDLAKQSSFVLLPGDDWPSEAAVPSGISSVSSSKPTSSTSATASPTAVSTPSASPTPAPSHGLGAGAIAGIAIGGSAVLLAAFVAIWFCGRQSRRVNTPQPVTPAQEVFHGYPSGVPSMYKPHMSVVSGYNLPPGYDQHGMVSPPQAQTPVDPAMMNSAGASPHMRSVSPTYGQPMQNMYAAGTHHVVPVEMATASQMGSPRASQIGSPRRSTDKPGGSGVERYG